MTSNLFKFNLLFLYYKFTFIVNIILYYYSKEWFFLALYMKRQSHQTHIFVKKKKFFFYETVPNKKSISRLKKQKFHE